MKRSSTVRVTLLASVAAACGCVDTPARCVDASNRVVADSLCANQDRRADSTVPHGSPQPGQSRGSPIGMFYPYRYYYGGSGMGLGSVVSGGTYTAPSPSSNVSHGGFGGEGEGHGGAGGAGEAGAGE